MALPVHQRTHRQSISPLEVERTSLRGLADRDRQNLNTRLDGCLASDQPEPGIARLRLENEDPSVLLQLNILAGQVEPNPVQSERASNVALGPRFGAGMEDNSWRPFQRRETMQRSTLRGSCTFSHYPISIQLLSKGH